MKQFIWGYLWELLAITLAIMGAICFAFAGNWMTMVWAILAGMWMGLELRAHRRADRIEREFREYIVRHQMRGSPLP